MTESKKIFIDTAPFIYFIEKNDNNPSFHNKMKNFFSYCFDKKIPLITSTITIEEYLVYPYKMKRYDYAESFERLLNILNIQIIDINKDIAKAAALIRANYPNFKSMDSLQLASAKIYQCDLFITNDKQLCQFLEVNCTTVDKLEI